MTIKRGLLLSGCGAWDAYNLGTLEKLDNKYNTIVGLSTGCLTAPMVALKEWEILKNWLMCTDTKNIFDFKWFGLSPISSEGKIRTLPIIRTLLLGNKTISTTNILRDNIDYHFSEESFNELRSLNVEVLVGVRNYSQTPSKMHYFNSLSEEFEEFKDWMWCGTNFPLYGSMVKKSWRDPTGNFHIGIWNSGLFFDFGAMERLSNRGLNEIDIFISKPKTIESLEGNHIDSLIDNVITMMNTMNYTIESEIFYDKIKTLNKQGVKVNVYWLPTNLNYNPMSYDSDEISEWWDIGYETGLDLDRVETFMPNCSRF